MPGRIYPLVTGQIYHVFNRGINHQSTFNSKKEYLRAITCLSFYRFSKPPIKLSRFLTLDQKRQLEILGAMEDSEKLIDIFCFCLMPNHFHILLKQKADKGISKFIGNFQNSYTRYANTRNKRDGSLFLDQFKAVRIENDEQFIHVSRYIHLNPYTGYLIKKFQDLMNYPYSSLVDYSQNLSSFIQKDEILSFFKKPADYIKFISNQKDYQRELKKITHLLLE